MTRVVLLLLSFAAVAVGIQIFRDATSVIHETAALLCFVIAAALLVGALLLDAVEHLRHDVMKELRKRNFNGKEETKQNE